MGDSHKDHAVKEGHPVPLGFGELSVSTGDHVGHFYGTREEWKNVLVPFLKTGLEAGDKCVFHLSPEPEERELRAELANAGVDVDAAVKSGQLVFSEGGSEPAEMREALNRALSEIPDRYPFLRWGGDMTWSFKKIPNTDTLMEWESMCNVIENPKAVFLCQYDLKKFMGNVVVDALKTHPLCIVGKAVHKNPFYEEPEAFLQELRSRRKA